MPSIRARGSPTRRRRARSRSRQSSADRRRPRTQRRCGRRSTRSLTGSGLRGPRRSRWLLSRSAVRSEPCRAPTARSAGPGATRATTARSPLARASASASLAASIRRSVWSEYTRLWASRAMTRACVARSRPSTLVIAASAIASCDGPNSPYRMIEPGSIAARRGAARRRPGSVRREQRLREASRARPDVHAVTGLTESHEQIGLRRVGPSERRRVIQRALEPNGSFVRSQVAERVVGRRGRPAFGFVDEPGVRRVVRQHWRPPRALHRGDTQRARGIHVGVQFARAPCCRARPPERRATRAWAKRDVPGCDTSLETTPAAAARSRIGPNSRVPTPVIDARTASSNCSPSTAAAVSRG